jgi:transposase InsO family protein
MRAHPSPIFPVIIVGPFTKWGSDYTTCNPASARGHRYIIVVVDYFTKWVEAMPMFKYDGETATLFLFNQIIARFGVPREIVTDHGSHFQNQMMIELTSKLGLQQEHSSPYYPKTNGQVEVVNKTLKTILQRTINSAKSNWHLMLYSTLWDYQTSVKATTGFSPFQLVYEMEAILPIECQIPSIKLAVQLLPDTSPLEEWLVYLEQLNEKHRDAALANEAHKHKVKCQYDRSVRP